MIVRPGALPDLPAIRLIVTDLDGVWTDNGIWIDDWGNELKRFCAADGFGVSLGRRAGLAFAVLSGRQSPCVQHRATALGVEAVIQNSRDKAADLHDLCRRFNQPLPAVLYMGDDLPDAAPMALAGIGVTVPHAPAALRALAHAVTQTPAGHGALRETIEWVLEAQGRLDAVTRPYFPSGSIPT